MSDVGTTPRKPMSPMRKLRIFEAHGGICILCGLKIHGGRGEKACMICIAQQPGGATREQLTVVTGYKRSSRDAYLQRLREKGYIEQGGDRLTATTAGIEALGADYAPLPTGQALRDFHLQRLPEGERRVLACLIDAYPDGLARDVIDESTGYKRSSRDAYIQRLSARQLVTTGGGSVRASDILFTER